MCSDLYKPLKNKQLNQIVNYYKFDLENSVNKSLFFKNSSGVAPRDPPSPREGVSPPTPTPIRSYSPQ